MNPMFREFVVTLLRYVLAAAGSWLVSRGVLTPEQSDAYVSEFSIGIAMFLIALGSALWARYKSRQKLVTALSLPATSENVVKQEVKSGNAPSVTTPAQTMPR